jgi:hypothetical protein
MPSSRLHSTLSTSIEEEGNKGLLLWIKIFSSCCEVIFDETTFELEHAQLP